MERIFLPPPSQSALPPTGVPGPFGPETPEESETSPGKSLGKSLSGCPALRRTLFGTLGFPGSRTPGRPLLDSFWSLPGLRALRARENPVLVRADRNTTICDVSLAIVRIKSVFPQTVLENLLRLLTHLVAPYRSIQNYSPRKIMFSELISRWVIYYAGKFIPQIIFAELIMRGNAVLHYVDRLFFGGKITPKNLMGIHFFVGQFQNCLTKSVLN